MKAQIKLIRVEITLLARDWGVLAFGLVFPAMLLLVLGAIPGFLDRDPDLGGARLIDVYTPIVLILVLALTGIQSVPAFLATYRTQGVLRRLRTTPVGPSRLLVAQLVAHLLLAVTACAIAVAVVVLPYDVVLPVSAAGVVVSLLLAAAAFFVIGLLVGAVAPSGAAAGAIATFVWLPLMVLAGLWFPREAMSGGMRLASDLSPGGAAVDALTEAWFHAFPAASSLLVMVAFTAVAGVAAVAAFRWE